ncbi:hypothetical protein HZA57_07815, partial [Candidatus Poribacteria bacterium]|nr:hypothetical protein [Candidatus Poribacteria bacterium]
MRIEGVLPAVTHFLATLLAVLFVRQFVHLAGLVEGLAVCGGLKTRAARFPLPSRGAGGTLGRLNRRRDGVGLAGAPNSG